MLEAFVISFITEYNGAVPRVTGVFAGSRTALSQLPAPVARIQASGATKVVDDEGKICCGKCQVTQVL